MNKHTLTRIRNAAAFNLDIADLRELAAVDPVKLFGMRNFGRKCFEDLVAFLKDERIEPSWPSEWSTFKRVARARPPINLADKAASDFARAYMEALEVGGDRSWPTAQQAIVIGWKEARKRMYGPRSDH